MDTVSATFGLPVFVRLLFLKFPYWSVLLMVVGFFIGTTMLLYWFLPRITKPTKDGDQIRTVSILVGVVGAFYGMLFGLVNVNLWQNYHKIQDIISQEANSLAGVVLNSAVFPPTAQNNIDNAVKNYIHELRNNEWREMAYKKSSPQAWEYMHNIFKALQAYQPANSYEQVYYSATLSKLNDAVAARRARIDALQNYIPEPLFHILVIGSLLLMILLNLTIVKVGRTKFLLFMSIVVNTLIALNLYLVLDLDNSFLGRVTIHSTPFSEGILMQLDKTSSTP